MLVCVSLVFPMCIPAFANQQEDYIRLIFTCDDSYAYCGFAYPYINYYLVSYYVTLKDGNGNTRTVCAESKELYEYTLLP